MAALILLGLAGCSRPLLKEGSIDRGHAFLGRAIADMVDRVDRVVGEPRVEDRQVKVKLQTGISTTIEKGGDVSFRVTAKGRIPLPALERKAHLFIDFGGDVLSEDRLTAQSIQSGDKIYRAGLNLLALSKWPVAYGVSFRGTWNHGPQLMVRPFLTWEQHYDPVRLYLSQEGWYKTDERFGETSGAAVDYILGQAGFLRAVGEITLNQKDEGMLLHHALLFRQPVGDNAALSWEGGVNYTVNAPRKGETYALVQFITPFWRPWLQLELTPQMTNHWGTGEGREYSLLIGVSVIFEDFLRKD